MTCFYLPFRYIMVSVMVGIYRTHFKEVGTLRIVVSSFALILQNEIRVLTTLKIRKQVE